jgi:peptidoglycan/xylan/chitin deacetylase (PgdA/CDA1 family)
MHTEISRAQDAIADATGRAPTLFRAPYGVRWPALGAVQREHGLTGVMWTLIGRDWTLDCEAIARRVIGGATPGAIVCLHDGRELAPDPDIRNTIDAVRSFLPVLLDQGWQFTTVSDLIGYSIAVCPKRPSSV